MDVACPITASFDIAGTAALYSALTGVLAGFAFTALILVPSLVLSTDRRHVTHLAASPIADSARVLVTAFLALVLTSLNYAVLGGEPTSGGRAAAGELVVGVGFAVAAIYMIYAIVLTLETVADLADGIEPLIHAAESLRSLLIVTVVPLALFYIYIGTRDYSDIRYGRGHFGIVDYVGFFVLVAQIVISLAVYYRSRSVSGDSFFKSQAGSNIRRLSGPALALAFGSTLVFAALQVVLGACDNAVVALPVICLISLFVFTSIFVIQLGRRALTVRPAS